MTDAQHALVEDGNSYLRRNRAGIGTIADPVMDAVLTLHAVRPVTRVLEIGCSTGFRLERIRSRLGAQCHGLEAGQDPVDEGRAAYPLIHLEQGIAPEDLERWRGETFDCVILGFFMYLLPRSALFRLAAAVDGLLADDGHLLVFDFLSPRPVSSAYAHHSDLVTYKADPSQPWLWSPTYCLVSRMIYPLEASAERSQDPGNWSTLDVLRKLPAAVAYPAAIPAPSVHDRSPGA